MVKRYCGFGSVVATAVAFTVFMVAGSASAAGFTSLLSVNTSSQQGNKMSFRPSLSADGRYVAFKSYATNLGWLSSDGNGKADIFVRDRKTGITIRVSVSSAEEEADGASFYGPSISANGRYVSFVSTASNLVTGDTNKDADVFVRDLMLNVTKRVSISSSEKQAEGSVNGEGTPVISADGRYVVFNSTASNLVSNDKNNRVDTFVRDTVSGTTTRISVSSSEQEVSGASEGDSCTPSVSSDGRYILFCSRAPGLVSNDTNDVPDIFMRDTLLGTTKRVSVSNTQDQAKGSSLSFAMSTDGRYVTFTSDAPNLVTGDSNDTYDAFVRDTVLNTTKRVSVSTAGEEGNDASLYGVSITGNGRYIVFGSKASNLVAADTNQSRDIFVRDTKLNTTKRVSVSTWEEQSNDSSDSDGPSISLSGKYIAFFSDAHNLVENDTNGVADIFLRDTQWLLVD